MIAAAKYSPIRNAICENHRFVSDEGETKVMVKSLPFSAAATKSCALLLGAFAIPSAVSAQSARPSFNCVAAKSESERMICRDAGLARLDREIAAAYAAALRRVDAAAAAKLREEQRQYLILRTGVASREHPFQESSTQRSRVASVMQERLRYLGSIRKPPSNGALTGKWVNFSGYTIIKPSSARRFVIDADAADTYAGRWTCGIDGVADQRGNKLVLDQRRRNNGSLIEISRAGDLLVVRETLAAGRYTSPNCGLNGVIKGTYFYTG